MSPNSAYGGFSLHAKFVVFLAMLALLAPAVGSQTVSPPPGNPPAPSAPSQAAAASAVRPDAKKIKEAYKQGQRAEQSQDWEVAFQAYSSAVQWAPDNRGYLARREAARSNLVQAKMDLAERDAIAGKIEEAVKDAGEAYRLDPTNTVVGDRLAELIAARPRQIREIPAEPELAGEIHLAYNRGKRNLEYGGDTRGAYQEIGRQFGVIAAFDPTLPSQQLRFKANDMDFPQAMHMLGEMTGTFWRPLTSRSFFVALDTPEKRKDYDTEVVRTIVLPDSETADHMTEMLRVVREITGITRTELDTGSRTVTLRASPRAIAVASDLIQDLEQPLGELVLEIEILEVDRNRARQIGITPPQTAQAFSVNTQELQEVEQNGLAGLAQVLSQVLGNSALSGLTSAQLQSEVSSGQLNLASMFPVVAFGGGLTTFFAQLPGAAANLSEMLSVVRQGRRILLRAQDGEAAEFFVGERYPVALGEYGADLSASSTQSVNSQEFPITNYAVGRSPSFVATAVLRTNGTNDLIVANSADNTVSILLGNGDGTFAPQPTEPTQPVGTNPVWIATGAFNTLNNTFVDLAVANENSNNVSILMGDGSGNFTPASGSPFATGTATTAPVAVVAANFHDLTTGHPLDLAVVNQGDNTVAIFEGNGDGTFKTSTPTVLQLPNGYKPSAIAAADLVGAGHQSLVVADEGNNSVSVFLGNGDGTFQARSDYAVGNSPVWVSLADFNADGHPDIAVANNGPSTSSNGTFVSGDSVTVLLNNGNGTFPTPSETNGTNYADYPAGNGPRSIAVADYDLDGTPDMAIASESDNAISFLFGQSTGGTANGAFTAFNQELPLASSSDPVSLTSADFINNDTQPDLAVANSGLNTVSVILNELNFSNTTLASTPNLSSSTAYPSVQYIDVGVKVKATPRVHPNNEVSLKLEISVSSIASQILNGDPVINNDSVEQTVRVKENETAALAGIIESQKSISLNGTPGISSLPGIGWLTTNRTTQNQDTELLILITPRMVRYASHDNQVIYTGLGPLEGTSGAVVESPGMGRGEASGFSPSPGTPAQPQSPGTPGPSRSQGPQRGQQ